MVDCYVCAGAMPAQEGEAVFRLCEKCKDEGWSYREDLDQFEKRGAGGLTILSGFSIEGSNLS